MFPISQIVKKIEVTKRSTFYSVKIWDRPKQKAPRVRIASIDKATGRAPYLLTILKDEEEIENSLDFSDVITTYTNC